MNDFSLEKQFQSHLTGGLAAQSSGVKTNTLKSFMSLHANLYLTIYFILQGYIGRHVGVFLSKVPQAVLKYYMWCKIDSSRFIKNFFKVR